MGDEKPKQDIKPAKPLDGIRKRKAPEERQTGKPDPYAYTITDKAFGEFKVLNSANAWWLDKIKVNELIQAYKIDATDEEACAYAGVSIMQLRYFKELHPDFSLVKEACRQLPMLTARQTIVSSLKTPDFAYRYMERKKRKEFGPNLDLTTDGEKVEGISVEIVTSRPNEAATTGHEGIGAEPASTK